MPTTATVYKKCQLPSIHFSVVYSEKLVKVFIILVPKPSVSAPRLEEKDNPEEKRLLPKTTGDLRRPKEG